MEFKVIKRNGNAVVPDGMFKLCGMENAKLISMVQLNGGILLMPESVSTFELITLIDALTGQACEFLEAVAAECGPAEAEHRDITLDEVLREFTVAVPDWAREKAGITADTKLDCEASEDAGVIAVYPASYRHDLTDVPRSILQCLLASGHSLYALNDILTAESENSDAEYLDMFLEWYEDSQRRTEHFMTGKTLGESGADMDRMSLISSAITKAFRGDSGVHARYMVVGGQSEPAETMSLNLSPDEQRLVTQALAEQRIRLGPQAEGEEKLLRRMVGNVTEYMDAAGLSNRLDEHDRALLAEHDGEPEAAPVMGGMQL